MQSDVVPTKRFKADVPELNLNDLIEIDEVVSTFPSNDTEIAEKNLQIAEIITIEDDDVVEDLIAEKNELSLNEPNMPNNAPIVINLAPSSSSSSSECSSPAKVLKHLRRKRPIDDVSKSKWSEDYCVTVDPTVSSMFDRIAVYKKKYEKDFQRFNKQIWNHLSKNLQNDKTFTWKMRVRFLLHQHLSKIFPSCHLIAVGSTINGCGAYNSDMDLCLCIQDLRGLFHSERGYAIRTLRKIHKRMEKLPFIRNVITIPAKVPILKFWFNKPYEALEVDLNINNMPGIYNSYLLHYYSRIDDRFPAICLLIKHWAKKADIGDASQGTLNSYSLILMVVHYLQVASNPPILPNLQKLYPDFFANNVPLKDMILFGELPFPLPEITENTKSVGELVIGFFKYYTDFDYQNNAISIVRGCVFPRYQLPMSTSRFKIYIEEPFDFQNTARCVTCDENWYKIYAAIQNARDFFLARKTLSPDIQLLLSGTI